MTKSTSAKSRKRPEPDTAPRLPPQSEEAEQSVLGGLLLDNMAWEVALDSMSGDDFYRSDHRLIFAAIGSLISAGNHADVITVHEQLRTLGQHETCGGLAYLNALAQSVPSAAGMRRYAEIVREKAVLRELAAAGGVITMAAMDSQGKPPSQIIDEAEGLVFRIADSRSRRAQQVQRIDKLVVQFIDRVNELHERGETITGTRTGFGDLDQLTSGLQPADLIVLAGRPSMGKTAFALNIAEHVAMDQGRAVMVFSMEMSASQLTMRMVGSLARIDQQRLRSGQLRDDEWGRLSKTVEQLATMPIFIDETPGLSSAEVRARARRQARKCGGLGLVVVDYLQLMAGTAGRSEENRATELGEISRGLKGLAKELKCPVIALSQLNRGLEQRMDKRPVMSDLRESGAIEQDADVIMFIYRDEYYTKEQCTEPGVAEVIIGKQRCGPTGTVKLAFIGQLARFENLASDALVEY